jgi:hypothetical protein
MLLVGFRGRDPVDAFAGIFLALKIASILASGVEPAASW